jgi:ESCRT-I complex subunit TSG101
VHTKLRAETGRLRGTLEAEAQQLHILEADLLKGEPAIRDELARLEAVHDVCTSVADRYTTLIQQLEARCIDLSLHRPIVQVDELVCSTTVLYNQLSFLLFFSSLFFFFFFFSELRHSLRAFRLWELVINDKVIEDLIYHLSKALNNSLDGSKIDLEKFLKVLHPLLSHPPFMHAPRSF